MSIVNSATKKWPPTRSKSSRAVIMTAVFVKSSSAPSRTFARRAAETLTKNPAPAAAFATFYMSGPCPCASFDHSRMMPNMIDANNNARKMRIDDDTNITRNQNGAAPVDDEEVAVMMKMMMEEIGDEGDADRIPDREADLLTARTSRKGKNLL